MEASGCSSGLYFEAQKIYHDSVVASQSLPLTPTPTILYHSRVLFYWPNFVVPLFSSLVIICLFAGFLMFGT